MGGVFGWGLPCMQQVEETHRQIFLALFDNPSINCFDLDISPPRMLQCLPLSPAALLIRSSAREQAVDLNSQKTHKYSANLALASNLLISKTAEELCLTIASACLCKTLFFSCKLWS
jgi:hypothetical protein